MVQDSGEILVRFWWEMWEARYMMARLGWAGIFFDRCFVFKLYGFEKIGCTHFKFFLPSAQLSKLTSVGPEVDWGVK